MHDPCFLSPKRSLSYIMFLKSSFTLFNYLSCIIEIWLSVSFFGFLTNHLLWNTVWSLFPNGITELMISIFRLLYVKIRSIIKGVSAFLTRECSMTCWYMRFFLAYIRNLNPLIYLPSSKSICSWSTFLYLHFPLSELFYY